MFEFFDTVVVLVGSGYPPLFVQDGTYHYNLCLGGALREWFLKGCKAMNYRVTRRCNNCYNRYDGGYACPECGSSDTGSHFCDDCRWAYDPDDYEDGWVECPKCKGDVYDIGEMWDNLHDDDWMFPNR